MAERITITGLGDGNIQEANEELSMQDLSNNSARINEILASMYNGGLNNNSGLDNNTGMSQHHDMSN